MNRFMRVFVCLLLFVGILSLLVACGGDAQSEADDQMASEQDSMPRVQAESPVEAGRYLVIVGGCNDCHTQGYTQEGGNIPESKWLLGSPMGQKGPWGTTYATNLRLYVEDLSEDEWVEEMKELKTRPIMPWFNMNKMSEPDLRAMYRYISQLEPKGEPVPDYVPPGQEPETPYVDHTPQNLPEM